MSVDFTSLREDISSRYSELKACGANKPGGGGFSTGNTCARGGKGGKSGKEVYGTEAKKGDEVRVISGSRKGAVGVLTTGGFARESYEVKFKDSKFPERISVEKLVYN